MSFLENQLDRAVDEVRKLEMENEELEQQNKRYREAIEYVINAKVNQYASVENIINDIKFVLRKTLESESE